MPSLRHLELLARHKLDRIIRGARIIQPAVGYLNGRLRFLAAYGRAYALHS